MGFREIREITLDDAGWEIGGRGHSVDDDRALPCTYREEGGRDGKPWHEVVLVQLRAKQGRIKILPSPI